MLQVRPRRSGGLDANWRARLAQLVTELPIRDGQRATRGQAGTSHGFVTTTSCNDPRLYLDILAVHSFDQVDRIALPLALSEAIAAPDRRVAGAPAGGYARLWIAQAANMGIVAPDYLRTVSFGPARHDRGQHPATRIVAQPRANEPSIVAGDSDV
jgi:hypothetical protein